MYQGRRRDAYEEALDHLRRRGALYPCGCTRKEIADSSIVGTEGPVYPGTCRGGLAAGRNARALRVRTDNAVIDFEDRVQGRQHSRLEREYGDFVARRADGFYAYQLAVVVDDAEQGITEVVRGADLLTSTARQIYLQQLLGLPTPGYLHLPAAVNARDEKLSKQTLAKPLARANPVVLLRQALDFLGQGPLPDTDESSLAGFWAIAMAVWDEKRIPRIRTRRCAG
jgi:glutamyl-Q tRNA(Asp) synthetase